MAAVSRSEQRVRLARAKVADLERRLARARLELEAVETALSAPLRGRDVATRALDLWERSGRPRAAWMHYATWFELVQGVDGTLIAGDDPLATFLTAISRDDRIESKGRRSGEYRPC